MRVLFRLYSALERIFPDREPPTAAYRRGSALRGEVFAFQAAWCVSEPWREIRLRAESPLGPVRVRTVENMPVRRTGDDPADGRPGLYPDLLCEEAPELVSSPGTWRAAWVSFEIPADAPAGVTEIAVVLALDGREFRRVFELTVIDAALPPGRLLHTEWLHIDSLAEYYHVEPWSEACWRIVENFLRDQARHGINMVLTPILTPALDTARGCYRSDVQLLGISRRNGEYRFDLSRLERWVALAEKCGMTAFELPPLFSQWGAHCAAPVMIDGERAFGWHTPAADPEYENFLRSMFAALRRFRPEKRWAERAYWHVSDEPGKADRDCYRRAVSIFRIAGGEGLCHLEAVCKPKNVRCCDVDLPVLPADAEPIPGRALWWYCSGGDQKGLTNRLVHFDPARNRWIGCWMFREQVEGFLHWGHNFYRTRLSKRAVNPYCELEAGAAYPAGDAFWVYPGADGMPVASMRYEIFHQGLQDLRALELLAACAGRPAAEKLVAGLDRSRPLSGGELLALREKINRKIRETLRK